MVNSAPSAQFAPLFFPSEFFFYNNFAYVKSYATSLGALGGNMGLEKSIGEQIFRDTSPLSLILMTPLVGITINVKMFVWMR